MKNLTKKERIFICIVIAIVLIGGLYMYFFQKISLADVLFFMALIVFLISYFVYLFTKKSLDVNDIEDPLVKKSMENKKLKKYINRFNSKGLNVSVVFYICMCIATGLLVLSVIALL